MRSSIAHAERFAHALEAELVACMLVSLAGREISFTHYTRSQNIVSHELAVYDRSTPRTAVWLAAGMDFVVNLAIVS